MTTPTVQPEAEATIWRDFKFSAAHFLPNVPEAHQCRRMHGHNYKVRVVFKGLPEPLLGWVADFDTIGVQVGLLLQQLDHRTLNDIGGLENPTSEKLCRWIFNRIAILAVIGPALEAVEVKEDDDFGARLDRYHPVGF
jgi:6-pyruvoyltetrahydropterin/6-carboxytetrahydropterin synthase